ncbi:PilN domain-containing protein [bacterium]|nr:PilN domain-containing protein [bacterium]MCI0611639.1 PilN domain-containing protein [bacterium]
MIIRNNLANNPVKNYSLYFLGCLVLLSAALLFTLFNARSLLSWQSESSRLQVNISEQQKKRADLQNEASKLRLRITQIKTPQFINETEFMNNAIKRRTFSWTTLFDEFERIFPDSVKMVSVFPQINDEQINITMEVAGKSLNDIVQLISVLQSSPAFSEVVLKSERQQNDGLLHAAISLTYLPEKLITQPQPQTQTAPAPGVSVDESESEETTESTR